MPIDDVDYLINHSDAENIIMMIDSRKRDKIIHPTPGEFEVIFDEPIRNVCGVEILDTSIPRTMFMTDSHNNGLRVFSGLINKRYIEGSDGAFLSTMSILNTSEDYIQYRFAEQDYQSADSAFLAFNDQVIMAMMQIDNFEMKYTPVANIYERGKSSFPIIRFCSPNAPFAFDISNSSARTMLGFCTRAETRGPHAGKFLNLKDMLTNDQGVCTNLWKYTHSTLNLSDTVFPGGHRTNDRNYVLNSRMITNRSNKDILKIPYRHHAKLPIRSFFTGIGCKFPVGTFFASVDEILEVSFSLYVTKNVDGVNRSLYYLQDIPLNSLVEETSSQVLYPNKMAYGLLFEYLEFAHTALEVEYTIELTFHRRAYPNLVHKMDGVYMEYGYFINTTDNKHFNEHTYFGVPIFNYEDTQRMYPPGIEEYVASPEGTTTKYAQKINPTDDTPIQSISKPYYVGTLPLGRNQTVLTYNPICNNIEIRIPLDPGKHALVDDRIDIYFIDIYENEELYVRVYLNATVENSPDDTDTSSHFLKLTYNASEEELKRSPGNSIFLGKTLLKSKRLNIFNHEISDETLNIQFQLFFQSRLTELPLKQGTKFSFNYVSVDTFAIQSPGMMNLATESYIMLRCEELENHLRGSFDMHKTSPGLGIVNIDVQGYAVNRLEFFSVKYKQFHPIGILGKLKFRFERCTDGEIYDFKNVDLHMLISIKFLRPKQLQQFQRSTLNPDYNPDFVGYLNRNMEGIEDESTDDDDFEEEYFEGRLRELEYEPRF